MYRDKKYVPTQINPAACPDLTTFFVSRNGVDPFYTLPDTDRFFPNVKEYETEYSRKYLDWLDSKRIRDNIKSVNAFRSLIKPMNIDNRDLFEKYMGALDT